MTTDLILHRILKAPRAAVWRCWTDPVLLAQWFVPKPHQVTEVILDLRPGGRFFTRFNVDGNFHPNDGSILAVVPGAHLVFTDLLLADWLPVAEPGLGFTASISLKDHEGGTEYHVLARHRTPESAAAHEAMGFTHGWGMAADQLEACAQGLPL